MHQYTPLSFRALGPGTISKGFTLRLDIISVELALPVHPDIAQGTGIAQWCDSPGSGHRLMLSPRTSSAIIGCVELNITLRIDMQMFVVCPGSCLLVVA